MEHTYFLGVDGGGSKTQAVITDEQGREIGRGLSGCANYGIVGAEQAINNIYAAVNQALEPQGQQLPIARAWLGLAGVDRPSDITLLEPGLHKLATAINITNDAELGLSVLPGAVGVVLIAGTGSISLGRNQHNQETRAGGWGHLLGDEGSGYYLGQQALLAAVRAADGRAEHTMLLDLILAHWNLRQADDIIGEIYGHNDKARVASLSQLVFQAYRQGDRSAQQIIDTGARELALVAHTVCRKLAIPTTEAVALALGGGLLIHEEHYRATFLGYMRALRTIGEVIEVKEPALNAARAIQDIPDFSHRTYI